MGEYTVAAKVIAHCMDSIHCVQYFPNDEVELTITSSDQRDCGQAKNLTRGMVSRFTKQLFWLKTDSKVNPKWIFQFDRANVKVPTDLRLFFCKACGQPFDRLQDLGNHSKTEEHNETSKIVNATRKANDEEEEERLLAERRAAEEAEEERQLAKRRAAEDQVST